jgi:acetylglutamate kinase
LSGVDGGLLTARPRTDDLGYVGDVAAVRTALLDSFLLAGLTPVIAPMAPAAEGGLPLNINADDAAAAIAASLRAAELLLVSDVAGVQIDGVVRSALEAADIETLIELGAASDGMAAKLRAAASALRDGVGTVRIGDPSVLERPDAGTRILASVVQPV